MNLWVDYYGNSQEFEDKAKVNLVQRYQLLVTLGHSAMWKEVVAE